MKVHYYLFFNLFLGGFVCMAAFAQAPPPPIVVDTASQEQTTLESAPNEVPIVNIARPNGSGVSHNLFARFNVEEKGLVLNNSSGLGHSKLAGVLMGNPHFGGGAEARLIVNEVTGAKRSELKGYTEIFGGRADYVLANPYGITCDGCGFINTPRATLSTGRPQFQNGNLHRLEVEEGNITITGRGSNTGAQAGENANVSYFDLVSRTVMIQGPAHANKIRVYGGQNDFYYEGQHIVQRNSGNDGNSPLWALDVAALGSIYANTIFILLTEQGAGARINGDISAMGDDFTLTADGRIEVTGQLSAQRNMNLSSQSNIDINSSIYARQNMNINEASQITVGANGRIFSSGDTRIMANQMRVEGQIAAGVDDAGILSRQSRFIANLRNGLENLGIIAAGMELQMTAGGSLSNQGLFYSGGSMNLYFNELTNDEGAEILSSGNLLMARNAGNGRASRMTNQSGRIETRNGDITIYSDRIENRRKNSVRVRRIANDPARPGNRHSADYQTDSSSANTHIAEISSNQDAVAGTIFSGRNMNLYANEVRNMYSMIYAGNDLNINSDSIINEGSQLGTLETRINWVYDQRLRDECTERQSILGGGSYCVHTETLWGVSERSRTQRVINPSVLMASIGAGNGLRLRDASGQDSRTIQNRDNAANLNPAFVTEVERNASAPASLPFDLPDTSLPTGSNGLFVLSSNPNSPYLIETNPLFNSMEQYIGSDYFFERSGLSLSDFEYYQRLGDPFYETRLIQQQIMEHGGGPYLEDDILSDSEQMKRLFENAVKEQKNLDLAPGIALTPEAAKNLTSDMIWMEKRIIEGKKVLVPQLYLANVNRDNVQIAGGVLRARNIDMKAASIVNEGGAIIAKENLRLLTTRGNIENVLGRIEGGILVIDSAANILNEGGAIMGERLLLHAVGDIVNETLTERIQTDENNYSDHLVSESFIGSRADLREQAEAHEASKEAELVRQALGEEAVSKTGQNKALLHHLGASAFIDPDTGRTVENIMEVLSEEESGFLGMMTAEGNILNKGAKIISEGKTQMSAGGNILFDAIALENRSEWSHEDNFEKSFQRTHLGAALESAGDIEISAGGDLTLLGSSIHTDTKADIAVDGNINVVHLLDVDYFDEQVVVKDEDLLETEVTVERQGHYREDVIGSTISSGDDLSLNAGGAVVIAGSELKAGGDLMIKNVLQEKDVEGNLKTQGNDASAGLFILSAESREESWYEKKTSHSILGIEVEQSRDLIKDMDLLQNSSRLEAADTLALHSLGDVLLQGSHLKSGGDMEIEAEGNVAVLSAFESRTHYESHTRSEFSDIDIGSDTSGNNFKLTSELSYEGENSNTEGRTISQFTSSILSGGDLKINAKKDVTIIAGQRPENEEPSGVIAHGDIEIKSTEGNLSILSANDVDSLIEEETEFTSTMRFNVGNAIVEAFRATYHTGQELGGEKEGNTERTEKSLGELGGGTEDPNARRKNPHKNLVKAAQALNFVESLGGLAGELNRAVRSSVSYGFYLEADLNTSGSTTRTQSRNERAIASLVQSMTGDVNLAAKKELKIIGSDIISNEGNINLYAGEKLTIEAAAQKQELSRDTSSWNGSVSLDTTGRISGSYGKSGEHLYTEGNFYRHSQLLAKEGTLNIISGGDALIRGALGQARHVKTDIAGELKLETVQDTKYAKLEGYNYNTGGNVDGGLHGGTSKSEGLGEYRWSNTQTALIGTESVDIKAATLSLIGSKIANEYKNEEGQTIDGGQLQIIADQISYQDLEDLDQADYQKLGGGLSYGGGKLNSVNLEFASGGHDKQGITRATIGQGEIFSSSDLSGLNREIHKAQESTKNEIEETVELSVNIGMDLILDPGKYAEKIAGIPDDLGELGKQAIQDIEEVAEKTENYFQTDHFELDENLVPILFDMVDKDIALTEGQEAKLQEGAERAEALASVNKYLQNRKNIGLIETLREVFSNAKDFVLDSRLETEQMELIARWHNTEDPKERRRIRQRVNKIEDHRGYFDRVHGYLNGVKSGNFRGLAQNALTQLCNVISYYLHGRATGTEERDIGDFIEEGLGQGRIGWNSETNRISLAYGVGSDEWRKDRGDGEDQKGRI